MTPWSTSVVCVPAKYIIRGCVAFKIMFPPHGHQGRLCTNKPHEAFVSLLCPHTEIYRQVFRLVNDLHYSNRTFCGHQD